VRNPVVFLISAIAALAVASPALAEPTWEYPVRVSAYDLTPGSTVTCFGNPRAGGQLANTSAAIYAWTVDDVVVPGATSAEYSVRNADLGHRLRCQMSLDTVEGPLSGTSEAVAIPVIDDGPPRLVHGPASLETGNNLMAGHMNVPAVVADIGPLSEAVYCRPGTWAGINGPTGSRWTFEILRAGAVVDTFTRDGDPRVEWRGYPAGWIDTSGPGLSRIVQFVAWHRRTPADAGQSFQCRVTVSNGLGQATSTSPAIRPFGEPAAAEEPPPAAISAKPASGVLRRDSFKVTYAGKGKLRAKAGKHVIATGTAKGSGTATLKLTAAGRKLLKRKHRLRVTITAGGTSTRVTLRA
jgi:hypothetical protein